MLVTEPASGNYSVSLVTPDGRVAASAQASMPAAVACGGVAAGVVPPPVSTSNSGVYFMDAQGAVRWLSPSGSVSAGPIIYLPIGPARRSLFAVSPNDGEMAVVVIDFTSAGATTNLYIDLLQPGGSQKLIFTESGSYTLWPVGWHGVSLVLAKVPSCIGGSGPLCCGPQEFHVVDPATGVRQLTLGGGSCGTVAGPPSPGGILCETNEISYNSVDWQGNAVITEWISGLSGKQPAYLSPNGSQIAVSQDGTTTLVWRGNYLSQGPFAMLACGWIDDTHIFAGGDTQHQPRVATIGTGVIVPVAAQGVCGGRIPGAL